MIQRVQSIYLLLVTILMSFLVLRPYADIISESQQIFQFRSYAIMEITGEDMITVYKYTLPVIILIVGIALISFITIFLYHRRILQIRMCIIILFLTGGLILTMLIYYNVVKYSLVDISHSLHLPMVFPMISIILTVMAIRAIQKDEILVNSYNRLR